MSKKTIQFSLNEQEYEELWQAASKRWLTPSQFVKMIVSGYITKYQRKSNQNGVESGP